MKTLITIAALLAFSTIQAQSPFVMHRYDSNDGGILWGISDNGKWATIRLGSSSGGGNATPKLYDVENEEAFEVRYNNDVISVNDVSDDGNIVVGSYQSRPVAYNRTTSELKEFPLRDQWQWGGLSSVTPDGKWAVGHYSGYTGVFSENDELTGDYYFSPLLVNVESGDTLSLSGLPKLDMANLDQHAMTFNAITPDGRYILGQMDWYIMQPVSGFCFLYDTQEQNYRVIGFEENDHGHWNPLFPDMHHIEGCTLSPNGRYAAGMAYMTKPQAGSEFFNEYGVPFRYDLQTGEFKVFDDGESNNMSVGGITDNGTIFGNSESGSPLRNFRIFYKDKYWISFSQICQQVYGFNFQNKTGYEYTGTVTGVSGDGRSFIAFPDPLGESYLFDFGAPVDDICAQVDLLSNYNVTPEAGSEFAMISNIEINFGRSIQINGNGNNVHLYKSDGTLVYSGLSNGGLTLKNGTKGTLVAAFRTRPLEAGVDYELVIDAGVVSIANDPELKNKEIRIPYRGRENGPVRITKITPEADSDIRQIDNNTSYILLEFDSKVKCTDSPLAYIERVADGSRLMTLNISAGTTEDTKNQVLLLPSTTSYLYAGEDYRLVFEAGSVCDYSGKNTSYNERTEFIYHGTYIRESGNETVMFADDFNDPNASLTTWMQFEGDHNKPTANMQAWGFDANNNPWNFTLHDEEQSPDYFAGSHSMYNPAGTSNDWMITPQLAIPLDGKAVLEFDAQSYDPSKQDYLTLYIYEERQVISHLNSELMAAIRANAVLLDSIALTAGNNPELTADEWTHYTYNLAEWAGKDIYVAFVNQNNNQSAIFVDNVLVQREVPFTIGFSNRDRVVAQESIDIAGYFTVLSAETEGSASMTLKDADGVALSIILWNEIPTKGTPVPFAFDAPLPLTIGKEVPYTIDVKIGDAEDSYEGSIMNLAFEPVKRVVLEEMTGSTCVNCPLGIVSIEHCQNAFGDRFIPIAIHSYTGDNLGSGFAEYTEFLGIMGAPMARINRLPEVYSPMYRMNDEFYYHDVEGESLWYDVVSEELNRLTLADISIAAQLSEDNKTISYTTDLCYALDAKNQQLSLLLVVLEDGISTYQLNGFSSANSETLADWCNNGPYAEYAVYPYIHDHVVRGVYGQTYSGTIGLYPANPEGGVNYSVRLSTQCPEAVDNLQNLHAVAMLIDTQTGMVVNAAQTRILSATESIEAVYEENSDDSSTLFTLTGMIVRRNATAEDLQNIPAGIYLLGNKKIIIK